MALANVKDGSPSLTSGQVNETDMVDRRDGVQALPYRDDLAKGYWCWNAIKPYSRLADIEKVAVWLLLAAQCPAGLCLCLARL